MRILIAPNPENIPLHVWPAGGGQHEVLQLANRRTSDGKHPPNSWPDLLSRCPDGWRPDVYICWSFEYRPVPEGIAEADCFTVGVIGDWNLGGQAIHQIGGAFDLLVADQNGCDRLQAAGYENVLYWPLWAYDAARHFAIPGVERDLDVAIIGNFNHDVQRERAPWLARVARMSRSHSVMVAGGIFGDEYTRTLNRAKIVFNRSIRGEINMRAYEAAACGALMFYERENREIGSLFRDREECVLYGDDDLEELVDYYLSHEDERLRIAAAGQLRVANCTYTVQAAGLFDEIDARRASTPSRWRKFRDLSADEQRLRCARQWLTVTHIADLDRCGEIIAAVGSDPADLHERHSVRACLLGERALRTSDPMEAVAMLKEAVQLCRWHLLLDPMRTVARVNCAELLLSIGEADEAAGEFEAAIRAYDSGHIAESQIEGPYFPRAFDTYTVEIERLWGLADRGTDAWRRAGADLLTWRCLCRLAEIELHKQRPAGAVDHARRAASLQPHLAPSWLTLARCHRAAGQLAEAVTAYRRAYELVPLDPAAWRELLACLAALGANSETLALADDLLAIIDGCRNFSDMRPIVERYAMEAAGNLPPLRTLLAAPDWSRKESWQPLVTEFVRTFRCESNASLALVADPSRVCDLETLLHAVEDHLAAQGIAMSEWPDLHIIHQSPDALEITSGVEWIDAILPAPHGPSRTWLPDVPRMTVQTFHLAFLARRPIPAAIAA